MQMAPKVMGLGIRNLLPNKETQYNGSICKPLQTELTNIINVRGSNNSAQQKKEKSACYVGIIFLSVVTHPESLETRHVKPRPKKLVENIHCIDSKAAHTTGGLGNSSRPQKVGGGGGGRKKNFSLILHLRFFHKQY